VHGVSDVRQTEIHTSGPLVLDSGAVEFDMAIEMVKTQITRYRSKPSRID
jgi:hypothetical protein